MKWINIFQITSLDSLVVSPFSKIEIKNHWSNLHLGALGTFTWFNLYPDHHIFQTCRQPRYTYIYSIKTISFRQNWYPSWRFCFFFQEKMRFLVQKMKIFKCVCKNFAVQKVGMWKFAESLVKLSLKLSVGIWNFHESFKWNFQPHKKVSWNFHIQLKVSRNFHETFTWRWKFHETFIHEVKVSSETFMKVSHAHWKFQWNFHQTFIKLSHAYFLASKKFFSSKKSLQNKTN